MGSGALVLACKKRKGTKGGVQHEDFPGGHPSYYSRPSTFNSEFDGIRCISAGMIAPISTCRMKCYKQSSMIPQQEAFRRCIFTGVWKSSYGIATLAGSLDFQDVIPRPRLSCFSTVIANRRHGVKRGVVRRAKEKGKGGCNTRTSREVTHPSTTLAQARFSEFDGIRCISVGMIAPISTCRMKCYKQSSMILAELRRCIFQEFGRCFPYSSYGIATRRRIFRFSRCHPEASVKVVLVNSGTKYHVGACKRKGTKGGCNTRTSEVTHPSTTLAKARLTRSSMGSGALVLLFFNGYLNRRHGVKRGVVRRAKEKGQKEGATRGLPEVTHPSTTLAQTRLTGVDGIGALVLRARKGTKGGCNTRTSEVTHPSTTLAKHCWYDRTQALLGVQKRKAKGGCNTRTSEVTHPSTTLAQARLTRSSMGSGALVLACKKRKGTKGGVQHEDFPGGHTSQYYSRPSTFNFGVLMGSGALVLACKKRKGKGGCNTRTSEVTHPSTTLAQARLTRVLMGSGALVLV
ncbi:hypothetical protein SADUNF_Sadunf17G0035700 [Salix dunnii]|uniref:Uncharacterized protein n=1 Tax=Salix dunnii TaxID=1413687 RepID=A0A835MH10_9ROSI|nr:hypothetical protein SADUNF_Sadunf17G0035700 [Salix dunnii]